MKRMICLALALLLLLTACDATTLPDNSKRHPVDASEAAPTAAHIRGGSRIIAPMD